MASVAAAAGEGLDVGLSFLIGGSCASGVACVWRNGNRSLEPDGSHKRLERALLAADEVAVAEQFEDPRPLDLGTQDAQQALLAATEVYILGLAQRQLERADDLPQFLVTDVRRQANLAAPAPDVG